MKYLLYTGGLQLLFYGACILGFWLIDRKKQSNSLELSLFSRDAMTVWKGGAILAILIGHIGNTFGVRYLTPLGSFGVAVFLLSSGYGLEKSYQQKGRKHFWRKRLITAYLPYWLIELVGYVFYYGEAVTLQSVLLDILLLDPMHPFGWYMQCLHIYYIAFWLAKVVGKKWPAMQYVVLSGAALAMLLFFRDLYKQQVFSFLLGVLLAQAKPVKQKILERLPGFLLSAVIGLGALAVKQTAFVRSLPEIAYGLIEAVQCTGLALAWITAANIGMRYWKPLWFQPFYLLGTISYEIYLIHKIFMQPQASYGNIFLFFAASFVVPGALYCIKDLILKRIQNVQGNHKT